MMLQKEMHVNGDRKKVDASPDNAISKKPSISDPANAPKGLLADLLSKLR
jgi:hypothetical protein